MLTNCCVLFTGYAWSHVMCSAGAISALLFPLVCALCLHLHCHFFVLKLKQPVQFSSFFLHTHNYTVLHVQETPNYISTILSKHFLLPRLCSAWWRSFMIFQNGKLLDSCVVTLVLCSMCAASRWSFYSSAHSVLKHTSLAIQVREAKLFVQCSLILHIHIYNQPLIDVHVN